MIIRNADSLQELGRFIASKDASAGGIFSRLLDAGRLDSSLCFIAGDGSPEGVLVLVNVRSGSTRAAFAACTVYNDEHTLAQLYHHAAAVLRERGTGFIAVRFPENERGLYFDRLGWEWIITAGFVPPTLDEDSLLYAVKRLNDEAVPSCQPLQLPPELGLPEPECLYYGSHRVTEEQLAEEIYITRRRRRLAERAAIIIFIIGVIAVGCIRGGQTFYIFNIIPMLGIGMFLLWRNIFIPRRVTAEIIEKRRRKGLSGTDDCYFFGRERFICFDRGKSTAIYSYDSITAVYDKGSYLFLMSSSGNDSAVGWYVSALEPDDKQAFIEHIRRFSPQLKVRH